MHNSATTDTAAVHAGISLWARPPYINGTVGTASFVNAWPLRADQPNSDTSDNAAMLVGDSNNTGTPEITFQGSSGVDNWKVGNHNNASGSDFIIQNTDTANTNWSAGAVYPFRANEQYGTLYINSTGTAPVIINGLSTAGLEGNPAVNTGTGGLEVFAGGTSGSMPTMPNGTIQAGRFIGAVNAVAYPATPTFDASLGDTQTIILSSNVTSSTLSNCSAGEWLVFDIIENSTGGYTFVWPSTVHGGGSINTTAGYHNRQSFYCDGTNAWSTSALQSGT